MSGKRNTDGISTGEYAFWLISFAFLALTVFGLITQFAIQLVAGVHVSLWEAVLIDVIASAVIWLFGAILKGGR